MFQYKEIIKVRNKGFEKRYDYNFGVYFLRVFLQKNLLRISENVKFENFELLNMGFVVVDVIYFEVGD